ncbi:hypothetical protein BK187_07510 [Brucella melitensis]|nr:hypothetical protein BK187_07510 [Brucella melitensis]EEZ12251.1 predicted protein [Brucella melitensis bv. 3 str. Ether]ARY28866.1 hypothetical protein BK219_07510 [Brucella melitensis]ARY38340.1 hypothetical protein BK217_07520 [Brucella melitensis]HAQ30298.1 hypothetical protein [Brucella melitensis]
MFILKTPDNRRFRNSLQAVYPIRGLSKATIVALHKQKYELHFNRKAASHLKCPPGQNRSRDDAHRGVAIMTAPYLERFQDAARP